MDATDFHNLGAPTLTAAPPPGSASPLEIVIFRGAESLNAPLTRFVKECVVNLLSTRAFLALLAKCMDFLPDNASPDIEALTMRIEAVVEDNSPIMLECQAFDKSSTLGRTVRSASSGLISVYISEALATAVEVTPLDAPKSPLLATLAVTKIVHQLCHWIRFLLSDSLPPLTQHVSHSAYRESGYALETAMWGGVVTAMFQSEEDTLRGGQVSRMNALCLEASPPWSAEGIRDNGGPPPTEYCLGELVEEKLSTCNLSFHS
ncbi:hypothetical protein C8R45DRAFT_284665 [Mycena sanguinolenta]|nr:hypothetical protein C8R45DRAFT_284665 [Mycena sanguinolenta]